MDEWMDGTRLDGLLKGLGNSGLELMMLWYN